MRGGTFDVVLEANCASVVNPVLDTGKYLPAKVFPENYGGYDDAKSIELYEKSGAETRPQKQAQGMRGSGADTPPAMTHPIFLPFLYPTSLPRAPPTRSTHHPPPH